MSMPQRVTLPRSPRAPWMVLMLVGLVLGVLGAAPILMEPLRLETEPMHLQLMAAGTGLFLFCFGLVILLNRQAAAELLIDHAREQLGLSCQDGSQVEIPFDVLARAEACADPGTDTHRILALHKRDGGVIELARLPSEEAEELVEPLRKLLDGRELQAGLDAPAGDPLDRMAGVRSVQAERRADAMVLRWKPNMPLHVALPMLGPFVGMSLIVHGFHRVDGGLGTAIATGFCLALAMLVLIFSLINVGVTQRVTIDARNLVVERMRLGRVIKSEVVPVFSVVAVDYSHQLSSSGAGLSVRCRDAQDAKESLTAEADHAPSPLSAMRAIAKAMQGGIQIPTGRMAVAERIALDLALGEELARRTGKKAAQL